MFVCCVLECKNNSENVPKNVSFHKFPETGLELKLWVLASGRQAWTPPSDAVMCSEHFQPTAFNAGLKVPIRFIHICRVCLSTNKKLYNMNIERNVAEHYTLITRVKVTERSAHQLVCWECRARLASASRFRRNAIRANKMLSEVHDDPYYLLDFPALRQTNELNSKLQIKLFKSNHTDYTFVHNNADKVYTISVKKPKTTKRSVKSEPKIPSMKLSVDLDTDSTDSNEVLSKRRRLPSNSKVSEFKRSKEINTDVVCIDFDTNTDSVDHDDDLDKIDPLSKGTITVDEVKVKFEDVDTSLGDICDHWSDQDIGFELKSENIDLSINDGGVVKVDEVGMEEVQAIKKEEKRGKRKIKSENGVKKNGIAKKREADRSVKKVATRKRSNVNSKRKVAHQRKNYKLSEKIFSVTELSKEEQLEEIQKRREGSNYKISPYKCEICYKGYRDENAYNLHMHRHTEKAGPYECEICKVRFKSRINDHTRKHSLRFVCKICPYVSVDKGAAKLHEKYHEGIKYPCPHCPEVYEKMTSYLSHLRIAHPTEHICELCGYSFINPNGLVRHKVLKHSYDEQQVPSDGPICDFCNIQFLNKQALVTHMRESCKNLEFRRKFQRRPKKRENVNMDRRIVVPHKGPIQCEQCDEQLPNFRSYFYHFRREHPDKNRTVFAMGPCTCMCEVCGRFMQSSTMLEIHKLTHSDVKQFRCTVCKKSYTTRTALLAHQKLHSNEPRKMFRCDICGKEFGFINNMIRHKFLHTGLRPHECEICGKTFKSKQEKQLHIKYVHMKKPWPKRNRGSRQRKNKEVQYNE